MLDSFDISVLQLNETLHMIERLITSKDAASISNIMLHRKMVNLYQQMLSNLFLNCCAHQVSFFLFKIKVEICFWCVYREFWECFPASLTFMSLSEAGVKAWIPFLFRGTTPSLLFGLSCFFKLWHKHLKEKEIKGNVITWGDYYFPAVLILVPKWPTAVHLLYNWKAPICCLVFLSTLFGNSAPLP